MLRLEYTDRGNPAGLPDIMWLKAGMESHSPQLAEEVGLYEREARFYLELQAQVERQTPRCFFALFDASRRLGVTLLEDLGQKGADLFHCTRELDIDDADAVLQAIAAVHRTFLRPGLSLPQWLTPLLEGNVYWDNAVSPTFLQQWLDEERSTTFPRKVHDAQRISDNLHRLADCLKRDKSGLAHGDAHIGNSYRVRGGPGGFYDWQCVGRGSPMFDVAYFIISALDVEQRRGNEQALIRSYLSQLNAGETLLSWDEAWLGYRRYTIYGLWSWLTNPEQFHPRAVNIIQSNRFATAVVDLDTFEAVEAWS